MKVTASLTRNPASWSNSVVRVRNSRQPQSLACLLYLQHGALSARGQELDTAQPSGVTQPPQLPRRRAVFVGTPIQAAIMMVRRGGWSAVGSTPQKLLDAGSCEPYTSRQ